MPITLTAAMVRHSRTQSQDGAAPASPCPRTRAVRARQLPTRATKYRSLARWYACSGDEAALELARKLTNFSVKPRFWRGDPDPVLVAGGEQGHFDSHFHARAIVLRGVLEYATHTNDERLKEFVRRSYEYARMFAIPRLGWAPTSGPSHLR